MKRRILALGSAFMIAGLAWAAPQATQGQTAPPQTQQGKGSQAPKPKSKAEQDALIKVQTAAQSNDPKAVLDAISYVLENFTDTEYKPMLLGLAVQAAQQTGDYAQTVVWGERAIQADPNDIQARVLLAQTIAANTHSSDLDKASSIKKIRDYANQALDLLNKATAPPQGVAEAKWPTYKAQMTAQAHDSLGQANALEKKNDEAIQEYKLALQSDAQDPLILARLAKTYNDTKQYDLAIDTADKALAEKPCPSTDGSACLDPRVKAYITAQKNVATRLKGAASPAPSSGQTTPPSTTTQPTPAPATK